MSISDALARLVEALIPAVGPIAGFVAAWIAFELIEWRRREIQKGTLRRALRVELETVEFLLSMMVAKFAAPDDPAKAVKEVRWLLKEGSERGRYLAELPQELSKELLTQSDDQIAALLTRTGWHQENRGVPIPLPTVEAILTAPAAGLSEEETRALSVLKWQAHLLGDTAHGMETYVALTFTVQGDENHRIAVANHQEAKRWYRKRAEFMLETVRAVRHTISK